MIIGKLYQIKQYSWMLVPSKEHAHACTAAHGSHSNVHEHHVAYWSKHLKCNINSVSLNDIFCLLEEDGDYLKVLSSNGEIGWMSYPKDQDWTKGCFEEVKQ